MVVRYYSIKLMLLIKIWSRTGMKIVTWNCNGAFRNKFQNLCDVFDPDIMVIQECEEINKLQGVINNEYNVLRIGDDKNKGLSILYKDHLEIERLSVDDSKVKYMFLIEVNNSFKIAAFWAMGDKDDVKQRYIGQVWTGLNEYQDKLDEKTMVMGDFNWNVNFSVSYPLYGDLIDVVNLLDKYQIVSSYHYLNNKDFGEELDKTFFMYRHEDKDYHIDYMFMPKAVLDDIKQFTIGNYEEWIEYSDHMPVFIEFS